MIVQLPSKNLVKLKEFTVRDQIILNDTIELSGFSGAIEFLESFILTSGLNCFDKFWALILLRKQNISDTIDIKNLSVTIDTIISNLLPFSVIKRTISNCQLDYPTEFASGKHIIERCLRSCEVHASISGVTKVVNGFVETHNKPISIINTKTVQIEINFFDESAGIFLVQMFAALSNQQVREYVYKLAHYVHDIDGIYKGTIADLLDYIDLQQRKDN